MESMGKIAGRNRGEDCKNIQGKEEDDTWGEGVGWLDDEFW